MHEACAPNPPPSGNPGDERHARAVQRAQAARAAGRWDEALAAYDEALAVDATSVEAHFLRGIALAQLERLREAIASLERAAALRPDLAQIRFQLGQALGQAGDFAAAAQAFTATIELAPDDANAWFARAIAARSLARYEDALADVDRALAIEPTLLAAHTLRGVLLCKSNRLDEALTSLEEALRIDPASADARWNRTLALLLCGDWPAAWPDFGRFAAVMGARPEPLWLGAEPLEGRTILLHNPHGLGDMIQFCRYATLVAQVGARVVLEAEPALVPLLRRLEGVDEIVAKGAPVPACDFQCPVPALPGVFGVTTDAVFGDTPYLHADPLKLAYWQGRLGEGGARRVGLVWAGNRRYGEDAQRSMALSECLPALLSTGAEIIALQKEASAADAQILARHPSVRHVGAELDDFGDTAAVCGLLDTVVSVDTSVAHLAGALGVPLRILLPYSPDWRWLLAREDTPWYPSARLYRQARAGDWSGVLARLTRDLADRRA